MYTFKTIERGAATSVLVATSPQLEGIGGRYFEDCNEAVVVDASPSATSGVAAYALDPEAAARLWPGVGGGPGGARPAALAGGRAARLWQVSTDALSGSRGAAPMRAARG